MLLGPLNKNPTTTGPFYLHTFPKPMLEADGPWGHLVGPHWILR